MLMMKEVVDEEEFQIDEAQVQQQVVDLSLDELNHEEDLVLVEDLNQELSQEVDLVQVEGLNQEELNLEEDQLLEEELSLEEGQLLEEELSLEEDQLLEEELSLEEDQLLEEELSLEEDRLLVEDKDQELDIEDQTQQDIELDVDMLDLEFMLVMEQEDISGHTELIGKMLIFTEDTLCITTSGHTHSFGLRILIQAMF